MAVPSTEIFLMLIVQSSPRKMVGLWMASKHKSTAAKQLFILNRQSP